MSYATLMVYVDAHGMPEQRVRLSATLADKFNATLIGMSAIAFRPPLTVEGVAVPGVTEAEIQQATARLARKGTWFRSIAGADRRKLEWRPVFDFPAGALAREARNADLVVIGRTAGPGDAYGALDPGDVILRLGRPTLVVPDGIGSLSAEHVVIGWKDTREARRAIQDSLPLLHEATRVTIVEICRAGEEEAAQANIDDVARYLGRHRIQSGPRIILHQEGSGAAQLIRLAREEHADLLVKGAYGHSRVGEWIFGGMTRDLLATSPICCLMSH
jgi:nucleotide-binding universal stress UspA family protein